MAQVAETLDPRSIARLSDTIRAAILSWPSLLLSLSVAVFAAIANPGDVFAATRPIARIGISLFAMAVFLWWSVVLLPRVIRLCLRRGWPVALGQIALYLPLAGVIGLTLPLLQPAGFGVLPVLSTFLIAVALIVIASVIGLLLFQTLALPRTGLHLTTAQIWLWTAPQSTEVDWLPEHLRGAPVRRMHAENQYTRVLTARGADLVRITLTEASAALPNDAGLRVHRSHWVATPELAELRYRDGNPRLILRDGAEVPVSRSRLDAVRAALSTNAPDG